jgi:hypothetical protein
MSLSYLGLLDTVLLSSVDSIITPCNLCEVLPTVTVQCDSPSFYPYSPECVEEEFCELRRLGVLGSSQEFIGNSSPPASVVALINFRRG